VISLASLQHNWLDNVLGGTTAAIVALPLALAFGIASGAGAVAGLYGAIAVGFFATILGGTPSQISGPTGPMTVVMTAMVSSFIATDPEHGLALAFTCVVLGGLIQIAFGLLRLGKYIIMVPYPVISGFMSAVGLIIIILQLGPLLGFETQETVLLSLLQLPEQISSFDPSTLAIGTITLLIVLLWRGKPNTILPAPLVALIAGTLLFLFVFPDPSVPRIGEISSHFPSLQMPLFSMELLPTMFVNALMLAILGSIDSLLTSLVADSLTGTQHSSDQELIGQGIGNTVAGLIGGLPGAGATMRTVINIRSGGSQRLSGVVHSLILLGVIAGLSVLFENIPIAALAAILIKVGIDIIDWPFLKRLNRLPKFPVMLMLLVLFLTVFVDLITAVFIGVFLKNLVTINKLSDLELGSVIVSDGILDGEYLSEDEKESLCSHAGEVMLLRISGPVSYAVARGLTNRFSNLEHRKHLLIDLSKAAIIGISTTMVLEELVRSALHKGSKVLFIDAKDSNRQEMQFLDIATLVGSRKCYNSFFSAIETVGDQQ